MSIEVQVGKFNIEKGIHLNESQNVSDLVALEPKSNTMNNNYKSIYMERSCQRNYSMV